MPHLLIFGLGYTASRLARRVRAEGWTVTATRRAGGDGVLAFDDPAVADAIRDATHILSSVPPEGDRDPVLDRYGAALAAAGVWIGYLSSTGVYGDSGGAWVDETSPVGTGRRSARSAADLGWQALRSDVHVLRLPGIYGPGRSAIDRVRAGNARRIEAPGQVFSRVHVDDIVEILCCLLRVSCPGAYNVADDLPVSGSEVIEFACELLGAPCPPSEPLADAGLSPQAQGFYTERRRVANGKIKRDLGYRLRYPDYRSGLVACLEERP